MATAATYKIYNGSEWVELTFTPSSHTHSEYQAKVSALGSTTKPVYISAAGTFSAGSTYAGGTKVTLNGTAKGGSTASFYAPTAAGTSGQLLVSSGSGAPTWTPTSAISVSEATKAERDSSGNKITDTYATKETGIYFIEGTQTAATNAWTGTCDAITDLYDGLTINYYLPWAGTSSGATLKLNGGTAYPIYRYGRSTQITTHFSAGSMIKMTFRTSYKVSGTSYTNAWIVDSFYDSNSYAYVRQYTTTTDATYPLLFAYETTLPSSYDTKYTRKSSGLTYNPYTNVLTNSGAIVANSLSALGLTLKTSAGDSPVVFDPDTATYTIDGSDILTKNTQSVIDLGELTIDPNTADNEELNWTDSPYGTYTFRYNNYTYMMYTSYFSMGSLYIQDIIRFGNLSEPYFVVQRQRASDGTWSIYSTGRLSTVSNASSLADQARNYACSSNTSSKIFLIGATAQGTKKYTYSHDTVYVNASGQLCGTAGVYTNKLLVPTTSGGTTYGVGSNGQVLMSNGTDSYWGNVSGGASSVYNLQGRSTLSLNGYSNITPILSTYNEVMIVLRVVTNGSTVVGLSSTTSGSSFGVSLTVTGTSYIKILINKTSEGYYAVDMVSSVGNLSTFGWLTTSLTTLCLRNYSTAATSVTMSVVMHTR